LFPFNAGHVRGIKETLSYVPLDMQKELAAVRKLKEIAYPLPLGRQIGVRPECLLCPEALFESSDGGGLPQLASDVLKKCDESHGTLRFVALQPAINYLSINDFGNKNSC
jgi:hypothetical protein